MKRELIKKIKSLKNDLDLNKKKDFILKKINNANQQINNFQTYLEKKVKTEDHEVVLQQTNLWVKAITLSIIGGTVFGIGWLSLAKTEEIVIVQGKLEPIGGVIDIQMPMQGITQEILVKEGETVEKGQILIKLDTEISESEQSWLKKNYNLNKEVLERIKFLADEGAVAELQYLEQKNKVAEIENQLKRNEVTLKYQNIISPIKGKVFDLKPQEIGFVAQSSEPIMKIVPLNKLRAKIEIDSRSIGFVKVGQKTDLSIDSFPASDFGVIPGEIKRIGSDALAPEPTLNKGYRFPANVELKEQFLKLKNGDELPLQPGMSLTANIKLRKVSYLQLLLGVFQDKADSLRSL